MKKLFLLLGLILLFAACSTGTDKNIENSDSTSVDSTIVDSTLVDSVIVENVVE